MFGMPGEAEVNSISISLSSDVRGYPAHASLIASVLRRSGCSLAVRYWCKNFCPPGFQSGRLSVEFIRADSELPGRYPVGANGAVFDRLRVIDQCPDWDKCLIMDYDQIAFCDLAPLFEMDLSDRLLAAKMQGPEVDMAFAMRHWIRRPFPAGWEHTASHPYFSMGPLLNLKEMRKARTWERLLAAQKAFLADENLALVAATEGRTMEFDRKWNLFLPHEVEPDGVPEGVVHWLGWPKPWHEDAKVWRPELWESESCSWEHLRMGLWEKPISIEVEPDDDHGVEELLRRGWKVKLYTGLQGDRDYPAFRYPDLEVRRMGSTALVEDGIAPGSRSRGGVVERVRFGPRVSAADWLRQLDEEWPGHVVLRGQQSAAEVRRLVALGYSEWCPLRHGEWASGGPMPRGLDGYLPVMDGALGAIPGTEEWYFRRVVGGQWLARKAANGQKPGIAVESEMGAGPGMSAAVKVAVVVDALGKQRRHLRFFLESVREHFLRETEVEVIVFTDADLPAGYEATKVSVVDPGEDRMALERFRWLTSLDRQLAAFDFVVMMRPHARFIERVSWENLQADGLVACEHSAYAGELRPKIRFEGNEASVAWVGAGEGRMYFCGSWLSGPPRELLSAARLMAEWAAQDVAAGVNPQWGAESYWNRHLIDLPPIKVLGPEYGWRTDSRLPTVPVKVLLQRTREPVGGPEEHRRRPHRRRAGAG